MGSDRNRYYAGVEQGSVLMSTPIYILGAGGFAREVATLIEDINQSAPGKRWSLQGMLDKGDKPSHANPHVVVAVGSPQLRRRIVGEARKWGSVFPSLVHPTVVTHYASVKWGEGSVFCAGSTLTCDIQLGAFTQVNLHCTIGHDVRLGDFNTLSPGVHLSGYVTTEDEVFFGTNAAVVEQVHFGARSRVGAGAVVVVDVNPDMTVIGVPAKPM